MPWQSACFRRSGSRQLLSPQICRGTRGTKPKPSLSKKADNSTAFLTGTITDSYAFSDVCKAARSATAFGLIGSSTSDIDYSEDMSFAPAMLAGVKARVNAAGLFANDRYALRIVTTVDTLDLSKVGVDLTFLDKTRNGNEVSNVYSELIGYINPDTQQSYTPDGLDENGQRLFSRESAYFEGFNLKASASLKDQIKAGGGITVMFYWITLDGTRVNGTPRTINYK